MYLYLEAKYDFFYFRKTAYEFSKLSILGAFGRMTIFYTGKKENLTRAPVSLLSTFVD